MITDQEPSMTKFDIITMIFFPLLIVKNIASFVTTWERLYLVLAIVWVLVSVWNLHRICKMYPVEENNEHKGGSN